MTVKLPEDLDRFVRLEVESGHFASEGEVIAEAVRLLRDRDGRPGMDATIVETAPAPGKKPFWEQIQEITASIPAEEWAKLPTDGAEQHDHYIYGTPKRPPSR